MNVRILRMCERRPFGGGRIIRGLGQMQPVIFGIEHGVPTLRSVTAHHKPNPASEQSQIIGRMRL